MLSELEDSNESFGAVAKRHNASSATLYAVAKRHRPDLIAKRKESGTHKQIAKTVEVTKEQRESAVQAVLSGKSVKDVAADTGIPAPTLYKWVQKAREKAPKQPQPSTYPTAHQATAHAFQDSGAPAYVQPSPDPVLDVLLASIKAAAQQRGTDPGVLCDLLKTRLTAG